MKLLMLSCAVSVMSDVCSVLSAEIETTSCAAAPPPPRSSAVPRPRPARGAWAWRGAVALAVRPGGVVGVSACKVHVSRRSGARELAHRWEEVERRRQWRRRRTRAHSGESQRPTAPCRGQASGIAALALRLDRERPVRHRRQAPGPPSSGINSSPHSGRSHLPSQQPA